MAQIRALANRLAADEIRPARRALNQQARVFGQQQTGFSSALAEHLGQIAPGTEQAFGAAAEGTSAFARGFADGELRRAAELSGQGGAADVLYGSGGFIPGGGLEREGAAFGAAARALPGTAALRGQENLASGQAQLRQALQELEATRPEKRRAHLQALLEREIAKRGLDLNAQALGLDALTADREFGLALAGLDIDRQRARQAGKKSAADKKGNRTKFWYERRNEAFGRAKELAKGKQVKNPSYDGITDTREFITRPFTWQEARRQLLALVGPDLRRRGFAKQRINRLVRSALLAHGFTKPPPMYDNGPGQGL